MSSRFLNAEEHRDHAVGVFKLWYSKAKPHVSSDVRAQCEAALAGEVPPDQIHILVDIIAQAYRETR